MNNTTVILVPRNITSLSAVEILSRQNQLRGWLVACLVTNAFGVIANILLLLALIVHKALRKTSSSSLLIHCVLIDLYTTTVAVPAVSITVYLGPKYQLPHHFCRYESLFVFMTYAAGMYAECIVALHRFVATMLPNQFVYLTRKTAIAGMIFLPWAVAVVINVFPVMEIGTKVVRSNLSGGCSVESTSRNLTALLLSTVFDYWIPTVTMGVCYVVVLVKTSIEVQRNPTNRGLRRRLEISRTLFLSFLWHCISIYPVMIVVSLYRIREESVTNLALSLWIQWLAYTFAAVNPLFFWGSSKLFQDGIKEVLGCLWCRRLARTSQVLPSSTARPHDDGSRTSEGQIKRKTATNHGSEMAAY